MTSMPAPRNFLAACALTALALAGSPRAVLITEFLASNNNGLRDSFGEASDWIEIYNDGPSVSLKGWSLTDEAEKPSKWRFPDTNLVAGAYIVVRASDRNLAVPGLELHTNFKLSSAGEYLALVKPSGKVVTEFAPAYPGQYEDVSYGFGCKVVTEEVCLRQTNTFCQAFVPVDGSLEDSWYRKEYAPKNWKEGRSGIGFERDPGAGRDFRACFGINLEEEMYGRNCSAYLRMPFALERKPDVTRLAVRALYDDGFFCYLNGREAARVNAPGSPSWNSASVSVHEEAAALRFEDYDITESACLLTKGQNVLCFQGLNCSSTSTDFLMEARLVAQVVRDVFFGDAGYFALPTPGRANGESAQERLAPVSISHDSGYCEEPFSLEITSPDEGAAIYYTLDATEPSFSNGILYTGPITVSQTTIIKALALKEGAESLRAQSRTYVFIEDIIAQESGKQPGPKWPLGNVNSQVMDYGMDKRVTEAREYREDLRKGFKELPILSIVASPGNLFDSRTGIYVNAYQDGRNWERYARAEYLWPDGRQGFNVGLGLRIRGGFSRDGSNPKHSFRLFFRKEYGDAKLEYPLFGDEGVKAFDKMDLRTAQNYSWSYGSNVPSENIMCRDVFARDLQRALGQPYTRSRYFHLLLNGHYWGLYQFEERPEEHFAADYFGGQEEDYDVIKPDGYVCCANAGTMEAWTELWKASTNGFDAKTYRKVIGRNPDGTKNPLYPTLLDPTNLADYMIINNYIGNNDGPLTTTDSGPNNFFAILNRKKPTGFKFFCHDSEHSLVNDSLYLDKTRPLNVGRSNPGQFNPRYLHQRLCEAEEYRRVFQYRVNRAWFGEGPMVEAMAREILRRRSSEIRNAIVCESARWGDSKTSGCYTRDDHWQNELDFLNYLFFVTRYESVLKQFQTRGWYPENLTPPVAKPKGECLPFGTKVTISGYTSIIYTTDGSDPLSSKTAQNYKGPITVDRPMTLRFCYPRHAAPAPMDGVEEYSIMARSPLRVTEIMYMPAEPEEGSEFSGNDFEFMELCNVSTTPFYPGGQMVTGGVSFVFPKNAPPIAPMAYALLVSNSRAFAGRYDTNGLYVAGEYSGHLGYEGASLCLTNYSFSYSGHWFKEARGQGPSIVVKNYALPLSSYGSKEAWTVSGEPYGSPGRPDVPEAGIPFLVLSALGLGLLRATSFFAFPKSGIMKKRNRRCS